MSDIQYPIRGACQCGNVSYELLQPPLMGVACHCRECQKLSTSAFSITAVVKTDAVRFHGELKEWGRVAESGNRNNARFCPECGNRIYHFNPDQPDTIKLKPSNLEDTRMIRPTMHVWVSEKQDWYDIPAGVEQHQRQPF